MTTGNAPTHTCSYFCDKPECIKAQRDELRDKLAALESQPVPVEPDVIREKRSLVELHGLGGSDKEIIKHIDALLSRIQVAQQERDGKWHRCPSCNNDFKQPFLCTTCGAEKLYDATLQSANQRAEQAEAKLAAIRSQPVPVGPECITKMRRLPKGASYEVEHKTLDYIDTLQSALQTCKHNSSVTMDELGEMRDELQRVTEERDIAVEMHETEFRKLKKAESLNKRMLELLKEIQGHVDFDDGEGNNDSSILRGRLSMIGDCVKAMSAELLKDAGE